MIYSYILKMHTYKYIYIDNLYMTVLGGMGPQLWWDVGEMMTWEATHYLEKAVSWKAATLKENFPHVMKAGVFYIGSLLRQKLLWEISSLIPHSFVDMKDILQGSHCNNDVNIQCYPTAPLPLSYTYSYFIDLFICLFVLKWLSLQAVSEES